MKNTAYNRDQQLTDSRIIGYTMAIIDMYDILNEVAAPTKENNALLSEISSRMEHIQKIRRETNCIPNNEIVKFT